MTLRQQMESALNDDVEMIRKKVARYVQKSNRDAGRTRVALRLVNFLYFGGNSVELLINGDGLVKSPKLPISLFRT